MKKILFILSVILVAISACSKIEYDIDNSYEKADISSIAIYDETATNVVSSSVIDTTAQTVSAVVKKESDITKLKLTVTVSLGANVSPTMSAGLQDLSQPKVYRVTSPNGTVVKDWTIIVTEAQ
ncbi:MAG: hypothetical protein ACK5MK_12010 [Dysgonomonas sp.]